MAERYDLFDIMQDYEPESDFFSDDSEKSDIEQIKMLVAAKQKSLVVKKKWYKRPVAAAVLALIIFATVTAGVDAATGGHLAQKLGIKKSSQEKSDKEMDEQRQGKVTIENSQGEKKEIDGKWIKNDDGTYSLELPDVEMGGDSTITYRTEDGKTELSGSINGKTADKANVIVKPYIKQKKDGKLQFDMNIEKSETDKNKNEKNDPMEKDK